MTWWTIEVILAGANSERVATLLVELTGQAAEERDQSVVGFAADQATAETAKALVEKQVGGKVSIAAADPTDWGTRWRDGLQVRRVGRLQVGPSWLLPVGLANVVIDPETAFGSGEHGSTRGALTLVDRHLAPQDRVLDLGSGSGILAIGAVKLGARSALGLEIDEDTIPIAEFNADRNLVADRARFIAGDAALLAPLAGPVELVVSNILRTVNQSLLEVIHRSMTADGVAVFAGMEVTEAPLFRPELVAAGYQILEEVIDQGWWSVAAAR